MTNLCWTSQDLEVLPDNGKRYEIVDGELYVSRQPHLEAVRKGLESHSPLLRLYWLLELLAPEALVSVNEKSTQRSLEWLLRRKQLINANWLQ